MPSTQQSSARKTPVRKAAPRKRPVSRAKAAASPAYKTFTGLGAADYVTPPHVAEIVNLAAWLGRPILVEGEAGCGKTRLAFAIAAELELGEPVTTTVKSTSQAKDLLYRFDALRRLQDAQDKNNRQARDIWRYIELQPLGRALAAGDPALVLIDEVDKADIDFPNDLLDLLDRFEFDIDELPAEQSAACQRAKGFSRRVRAPAGGVRPIVVITSNREKQLPEPFLRRCLYVQLQFPEHEDTLRAIVRKNLTLEGDSVSDALIAQAVAAFRKVREAARERALQKPPATSELVDWVRALHWRSRADAVPGADTLDEVDRALLFKVQKDLERWDAGATPR